MRSTSNSFFGGVDLVRTSAPAQNDPSAVFECSSQLPSRCCDDRLNPPLTCGLTDPEGARAGLRPQPRRLRASWQMRDTRLIVLGNGPRHANGLGPRIPKLPSEFNLCTNEISPLTRSSPCEAASLQLDQILASPWRRQSNDLHGSGETRYRNSRRRRRRGDRNVVSLMRDPVSSPNRPKDVVTSGCGPCEGEA